MEEMIWNVLMDLKQGYLDEDEAARKLTSLTDPDGSLPTEFAEWVGTHYEQDNGSVVGNVYYDRQTRKDYSIPELWGIFIQRT